MVTHSPIVTKLLALGFSCLAGGGGIPYFDGEGQRGSTGLSSLTVKVGKGQVFRMLPGC